MKWFPSRTQFHRALVEQGCGPIGGGGCRHFFREFVASEDMSLTHREMSNIISSAVYSETTIKDMINLLKSNADSKCNKKKLIYCFGCERQLHGMSFPTAQMDQWNHDGTTVCFACTREKIDRIITTTIIFTTIVSGVLVRRLFG
jgi:hypothetical protein